MYRSWRRDVRVARRLEVVRPQRRYGVNPHFHQGHAMLTPETLPEVQRALADAGVDGWLLYDFRGLNPIARDLMRLDGMTTRRVFAFIPTLGTPVALTHAIEQTQWHLWPTAWTREVYSSWRSLESL